MHLVVSNAAPAPDTAPTWIGPTLAEAYDALQLFVWLAISLSLPFVRF